MQERFPSGARLWWHLVLCCWVLTFHRHMRYERERGRRERRGNWERNGESLREVDSDEERAYEIIHKSLGIPVIIFRVNTINRRRGLHSYRAMTSCKNWLTTTIKSGPALLMTFYGPSFQMAAVIIHRYTQTFFQRKWNKS